MKESPAMPGFLFRTRVPPFHPQQEPSGEAPAAQIGMELGTDLIFNSHV